MRIIAICSLIVLHTNVLGQVEKNWYAAHNKVHFDTISKTIGFLVEPGVSEFNQLKFYKPNGERAYFTQTDFYLKDDYETFCPLRITREQKGYFVTLVQNKAVLFEKCDTTLTFETWEEHIVRSVAAVGFNPKLNPIRAQPNENSPTMLYNHDEFYHPIKIRGDWLLLKEYNKEYGWIKWREGDFLLIDIFYLL